MVIVCSGDINSHWFFKIIEEKFSNVKNNYKPNNIISKWSPGFCGEERDLEQTQLVFGIEGLKNSDIDRYSLRALTIILGGGMSSRLFQEIREKKGLCYSIFAFSQIQKTYGTLGFYAGTSPDNVDDLIDTSLKELKKIKLSLSDHELSRAKAQMKAGFIMGQESNSARAEYIAKCMLDFGKIIKSEEVKEKIENITINSIYQVADKLLTSSDPVLSIIGPGAGKYKKLGMSSLLN